MLVFYDIYPTSYRVRFDINQHMRIHHKKALILLAFPIFRRLLRWLINPAVILFRQGGKFCLEYKTH